MTMEDEEKDPGLAAKFLRTWGVEVTVDAAGGYLVENGGQKFRLSERELVVFAGGYCAGWQHTWPRRKRRRNTNA